MQRGGTKLPTFATATQLIVAGVGVAAKFSRYAGVCGCSNARKRKRERGVGGSSGTENEEERHGERTEEKEREKERERKSSIDVISSTRLKGDSYIAL